MRGKIIRLPVCFAGSRPAMIMLALAPPSIAVVSFDHRCATAIPHVVTGRPGSSPHRSSSKQASNARRQQTASIEIPIASDARHRHTSRGFLLWSFAYAGPRCPPRHHHGAGIRKPSQQRPLNLRINVDRAISFIHFTLIEAADTPRQNPRILHQNDRLASGLGAPASHGRGPRFDPLCAHHI